MTDESKKNTSAENEFEKESTMDGKHSRQGRQPGHWETRFEEMAMDMRGVACGMRREMENAMMTLLPPTVTRQLVEAHKEVIRAGQRLGDLAIAELEKKAARAESMTGKRDQDTN